MLTGSYFNTVDEKGRVFIPTKLRYSLGERIWLVKGADTCLYVFTQDSWADFAGRYINNLTLKDSNARKAQRFFAGSARELEIDKQGRINLPQEQMDYAGIKKDVVIMGCVDRIEIWSAEAHAKEMENLDPDQLMRDAQKAADGE